MILEWNTYSFNEFYYASWKYYIRNCFDILNGMSQHGNPALEPLEFYPPVTRSHTVWSSSPLPLLSLLKCDAMYGWLLAWIFLNSKYVFSFISCSRYRSFTMYIYCKLCRLFVYTMKENLEKQSQVINVKLK